MNKTITIIIRGLIVGIAFIIIGCNKGESPEQASALPDKEAIQERIKQSIANYPGQCPCPYSLMANGVKCGKRSAWSRKDGESPLCYESDLEPVRYEWGLSKQETQAK